MVGKGGGGPLGNGGRGALGMSRLFMHWKTISTTVSTISLSPYRTMTSSFTRGIIEVKLAFAGYFSCGLEINRWIMMTMSFAYCNALSDTYLSRAGL